MALFDKLFSLKRRLDSDKSDTRDRCRSCHINSEQVRLLLYKECDRRGRRLLFDSSSIKKVPASKNDKPNTRLTDEVPCIVEVSNGYTYMYKGPEADASVLGEMIFGAVAMNYKSVSLKIHIMDEPRRLMCTKVFCVPNRRMSRVERKTSDRTDTNCSLSSPTTPLSVPALREEGVSLSFSIDRGDSGFCGDHSPYSSVGSTYDYFSMYDMWDGGTSQEDLSFHSPFARKLSSSSNGSWQRRTFHNVATRFSLGHSSQMLHVPTASSNTSDSQLYSNSSTSGTNDSIASALSVPQKKNKLGLAILITVNDAEDRDLVLNCLEHSPQLQALLYRVRVLALAAGAVSATFVSSLVRASELAARWLSDLVYGPRIQPMWLTIVCNPSSKLAESLVGDLCAVLAVGDTKTTHFFISTLLTYVLTYHLGWVPTVSPYDTVDHKTVERGVDEKPAYNALWAQLSDLCGSIGFPPRAARTIISGEKNSVFVNRLLIVLTYFLRCGDVTRTHYPPRISVPKQSKTVLVKQCVAETVNTQNSDSSVSTLVASDHLKRSSTLAALSMDIHGGSSSGSSMAGPLRRHPLAMLKASSDSSLTSNVSEESEPEQKVVFVLGDNEKLVGLKNKSSGGKSVKKSSKTQADAPDTKELGKCDREKCERSSTSPSKCCGQTLQHSKPIKHSGFKFEFDKYPQIVTNYMKSKNLEILDRHYIGKPGNLKLDNFQFDPTIVPPIQEERCETCVKCQMMEATLQTPTNASEMEYLNDLPRTSEPQFAKAKLVIDRDTREISPKTFVRKRKNNTVVVNFVNRTDSVTPILQKENTAQENSIDLAAPTISIDLNNDTTIKPQTSLCKKLKLTKTICNLETLLSVNIEDGIDESTTSQITRCDSFQPSIEARKELRPLEIKKPVLKREKIDKLVDVKRVIEFPLSELCADDIQKTGFGGSLLGGVTDHYVPDLVLQGTSAKPTEWESELRRDLDLTMYLNKTPEASIQTVAIVGDTNTWEVRVLGRVGAAGAGGGMSPLVAGMLDALPVMRRARVPPQQCLTFVESKLREVCVLSKTLAELLMSRDFCDIATLTSCLSVDVNDVPLLLAVATTHTPQLAARYGITYR